MRQADAALRTGPSARVVRARCLRSAHRRCTSGGTPGGLGLRFLTCVSASYCSPSPLPPGVLAPLRARRHHLVVPAGATPNLQGSFETTIRYEEVTPGGHPEGGRRSQGSTASTSTRRSVSRTRSPPTGQKDHAGDHDHRYPGRPVSARCATCTPRVPADHSQGDPPGQPPRSGGSELGFTDGRGPRSKGYRAVTPAGGYV